MGGEDSRKNNRVGRQFTQKQSTQGGLHATFPVPVTFSAPSWIKLCFLKIKRHKGDKGHATGLLLGHKSSSEGCLDLETCLVMVLNTCTRMLLLEWPSVHSRDSSEPTSHFMHVQGLRLSEKPLLISSD